MSDMMEWREPSYEEEESGPLVNGFTFWEALQEAAATSTPTRLGVTKPLADFIREPEARATIRENGWRALACYLADMGKQRAVGNPHLQT
jgi:hypothetical protein